MRLQQLQSEDIVNLPSTVRSRFQGFKLTKNARRYIRIRMGKSGDKGKDAITIAEGSNMIFDHISVSWGRDETFSISGSR